MKRVYTDDAPEGLIRLREFIAQWSPEAANRTGAGRVASILHTLATSHRAGILANLFPLDVPT